MGQSNRPTDEEGASTPPRWHAPPRPRDALIPPPTPPDSIPADEADASVRRLDRIAPALLTALLLLIVGVVIGLNLRNGIVPSVREPTVAVARPTGSPPPWVINTNPTCFSTFAMHPTDAPARTTAGDAERLVRDGYDLPFREARLGTLIEARPVALTSWLPPQLASSVQATLVAASSPQTAWLLAFARTPPLAASVAPPPGIKTWEYSSFLYALVDGDSGRLIQQCDGAGNARTLDGAALPQVPVERSLRHPFEEVRGMAGFAARGAIWLPFAPIEQFARVSRLPEGKAEVVADYFAVGGDGVGERVRVISTTRPPLLATSERGGQAVALADGRDARFDDLTTLQVLTWREGDLWYQVVAARPSGQGAPYTLGEMLKIAAGLR